MAILRQRLAWTLAPLLALSVQASIGRAGTAAEEYDLKAAFLVNFARLVEWPEGSFASDEQPLVIGVLADAEIGALMERRVKGVQVDARTVRVKQLESVDQTADCHLVFLASSRKKNAGKLIAASGRSRVLTVGESDGFTRAGGMISFYEQDRKIRFEVNRGAASEAGFRISSRLLKLARIVSSDDSSDR